MAVVSIAAGTLTLGSVAQASTPKLKMTAVSTKAQYVTGGDVLLRLRPAVNDPRFTARRLEGPRAVPRERTLVGEGPA